MKARLLAIALAAPALAACNGDRTPGKPATPANLTVPISGTTLSADQQCLSASVCDQWSGCALVAKAPQFWTVIAADRFAPGDPVDVTNVCTSGDTCIAFSKEFSYKG
jgi:hypothetical protein